MKKTTTVLAFDLGASSGRAIKASYQTGTLTCEEIHRFENNPVTESGHLCWDFPSLLKEIQLGIQKAGEVDSIGIDTWGVDFGLLDEQGQLLGLPVHYRDTRTDGMIEKVFASISPEELYKRTGNQIMAINSLFQLIALKENNPDLLDRASHLLFMPDLIAYALTGSMHTEKTIASTSQMLNPHTGDWDYELIGRMGIPKKIFQTPIDCGNFNARTENGSPLCIVAGHDTQCAVAAIPVSDHVGDIAFVSCGTWSLLGTELDSPILTPESCQRELSNELGANGKINYLQNIIGLWLIQESRREYRRQGKEYSYADLEREALQATPFRCFIDPNHPVFVAPGNIPQRIQQYCKETGQYIPQTVGEIIRCIYESLALTYRHALEQLSITTKRNFTAFHVLGGGAKDGLLCQMTADFIGIPVIAGPVEATALGNIMIQLIASGALTSFEEGRALIAKTQKVVFYPPRSNSGVEDAYQRYLALSEQASQLKIQ